MPHRAPFLCLNWAAVCAPMNYSIHLLRRSEVCLEKQRRAHVHVGSLAQKQRCFPLIVRRLKAWVWLRTSCPPPFPVLFLRGLFMGHVVSRSSSSPCLIFRQLESLYTSVTPHQHSAQEDESFVVRGSRARRTVYSTESVSYKPSTPVLPQPPAPPLVLLFFLHLLTIPCF